MRGHFRSLLAQHGLTPKSKRGLAHDKCNLAKADHVAAARHLDLWVVFVPLSHRPGTAQADFGEVTVILNGETIKAVTAIRGRAVTACLALQMDALTIQ